ncbi:MAG: replication protein DnaC [Petroclostridium sp.]|jgi:DNA replication protein DnaC|uniref:ATP-binding protein n=1 Tax=Petroclostridium xylanilyticum TaxID=1792311 RepID=UPI000B9855BA|nr:ATP-binding protein [Petroclostridium xylanilyticum]MBZ4646158.1 family ATPase [Clostridia bacterium]MDK2810434.1 replication protein DnaC [Petroclostridium sp.]
MAYDKQIYTQIMKEYEMLRDHQRMELERKKAEIYKKIPRIEEIDQELYSTGLSLTRQLLHKSADAEAVIEQIRQRNIDLNMEKGELLSINGYPVDYLTIKHKCKNCKDTGFVDNVMCKCFKQKLIQAAYAQSNLAAILDTQNFDNFDFSYYSTVIDRENNISPRENMQIIFQECINFVNNFDKSDQNLLLYGGTGLGKTFLSSCIAKDLLDRGKTVFYQTAYKIFNLLEDYKFNRSEASTDKQQIDRLFDVDLLIIDDLGSEFISTYTSSAFFNILNSRLIDKRKTIISTNLNIEELINLYSERVISRLLGNYLPLKFFGEDIRQQKIYKCV